MTRTLVTGATGFLGRALTARLRQDGDQVIALGSKDADLLDVRSLDRFLDQPLDRIFHLAAWTQAGDFCLRHPGEQWINNQLINTTALKFWAGHPDRPKLVSIGTSCVYEEGRKLVEDQYMEGHPIDSLYTYAMTKRMMLIGQRSLAKQFGLRHLTVVPSTLYGPGYTLHGKQMHFIFDLAAKMLRSRDGGPGVVLWGDGHQRRELIYVDDFIDDMLYLTGNVDDEVVNIGAGTDHSIREFAGILANLIGIDADDFQYDTSKYTGAKSKSLDISKLRNLRPDLKRTELVDGLSRMVRYMKQHLA
ncbi:NAD-dependent epimerase/dehydratase family protein [Nisaea sp.]|uniref:NAD-dependent epimerase/dehydratase family protein n=1 Tax=Nisaea sp. TaxID=2024842 RepID=UPI0032EC5A8E